MDKVQLHQKIDDLNDQETERCLQVLVKGFAIRHGYEEFVVSENQLREIIRQYTNLVWAHKQKDVRTRPALPMPAPGAASTIDPSNVSNPKRSAEGIRVA